MSNLRDIPRPICHKDLMLASPGKLFSAPAWVYELKHDGSAFSLRSAVTSCVWNLAMGAT
jgi:hypothetical protein